MSFGLEHETRSAAGTVAVRYWAGARAAAGVESETVEGSVGDIGTLKAVLEQRHPDLGPVLLVASLLVNGHAASDDTPLTPGVLVEVLPPFAGG